MLTKVVNNARAYANDKVCLGRKLCLKLSDSLLVGNENALSLINENTFYLLGYKSLYLLSANLVRICVSRDNYARVGSYKLRNLLERAFLNNKIIYRTVVGASAVADLSALYEFVKFHCLSPFKYQLKQMLYALAKVTVIVNADKSEIRLVYRLVVSALTVVVTNENSFIVSYAVFLTVEV